MNVLGVIIARAGSAGLRNKHLLPLPKPQLLPSRSQHLLLQHQSNPIKGIVSF